MSGRRRSRCRIRVEAISVASRSGSFRWRNSLLDSSQERSAHRCIPAYCGQTPSRCRWFESSRHRLRTGSPFCSPISNESSMSLPMQVSCRITASAIMSFAERLTRLAWSTRSTWSPRSLQSILSEESSRGPSTAAIGIRVSPIRPASFWMTGFASPVFSGVRAFRLVSPTGLHQTHQSAMKNGRSGGTSSTTRWYPIRPLHGRIWLRRGLLTLHARRRPPWPFAPG